MTGAYGICRSFFGYGRPKCSRVSGVAWGQGCVRCGAARAVWLHDTPVSHPSPRIRVCTPVCAEAVKSCDLCSDFEPAKALIRWLPLPQSRVLPSPVRGLPFATRGIQPGRRDPGWDGVLGGKTQSGGWVVASSPAFMPARRPKCVCASVQWRTLFGCRCRSRTVPYGPRESALP